MMSTNTPIPKSRFSVYTDALKTISKRTGAPLPSLILSFGIVHELTALVPLVGIFYASRTLGVGEAVVNNISPYTAAVPVGKGSWVVRWGKEKIREWVEEGDQWAKRVGKRYNMFGYEKQAVDAQNSASQHGHRITGDIANAVVAYGITKALLPARVGLSLYLTPGFARSVLNPAKKAITGVFKRPQP